MWIDLQKLFQNGGSCCHYYSIVTSERTWWKPPFWYSFLIARFIEVYFVETAMLLLQIRLLFWKCFSQGYWCIRICSSLLEWWFGILMSLSLPLFLSLSRYVFVSFEYLLSTKRSFVLQELYILVVTSRYFSITNIMYHLHVVVWTFTENYK